MDVKFTKLTPVTGEIVVELAAADYKDKVKDQLKKIAKTHQEPGFRAGKVPASLVEKKYGNAVKYDVVNKEIGEAVYNYINENKLRVLGNPVPVKDQDINFEDDDFTFKFNVGLAPEIASPVNKDMKIPYYKIEVSDEMIAKQDEAMRRHLGKQVPGDMVEPNCLVKGVLTELNEDGTVKEGGIVVENGIVAPSYFKGDEEKKFEGKKPGEEVVFNPAATCEGNETELSSMLNINKAETKNHHGDFNMNIKEIIVLRPAEDGPEYFDALFGPDKVHNADEYKEALKEMIARQLESDSVYRFSIDARNAILEAVGDIELPDEILMQYLHQQNDKLSDEEVKSEYERLRKDLVWQLERDIVAEQLKIQLSEEDLKNVAKLVVRNQFAQYGMSQIPDESLEKYSADMLKDPKARENIANQALDMKLYQAIRNAVTLDEKLVSVDDFNKLFAPAQDAAE